MVPYCGGGSGCCGVIGHRHITMAVSMAVSLAVSEIAAAAAAAAAAAVLDEDAMRVAVFFL